MARWDEDFEVPHDPLTALALLQPELFTFAPPRRGRVSDGGDAVPAAWAGRRRGSVRIATGVDIDAARTAMADRIARGLGERQQHAEGASARRGGGR